VLTKLYVSVMLCRSYIYGFFQSRNLLICTLFVFYYMFLPFIRPSSGKKRMYIIFKLHWPMFTFLSHALSTDAYRFHQICKLKVNNC
jgi:hypothetical protein